MVIKFVECQLNKIKMKILNLLIISLIVLSCEVKQDVPKTKEPTCKEIRTSKVIKDTKEHQEQYTDYEYKYDIWNGKFRQQPNIHTDTKYFLIFTDNTHKEVVFNDFLSYSKGDTLYIKETICE